MKSIVLPVFNEEGNIAETISRVQKAIEGLFTDFEIIVVDNKSSDNTCDIVRDLQQSMPELRLVCQSRNLGYRGNVQTGILNSRGDRVFVFDGDGQFDPIAIVEMNLCIDRGADLVLGYRSTIAGPPIRRFLSKVFILSSRLVIGFKMKDLNAGARALSRRLVELEPITCGSSMVNAELFLVARTNGLKIEQVRVGHEDRATGFSTHDFLKPFILFQNTIGYLFLLRRKYLKTSALSSDQMSRDLAK